MSINPLLRFRVLPIAAAICLAACNSSSPRTSTTGPGGAGAGATGGGNGGSVGVQGGGGGTGSGATGGHGAGGLSGQAGTTGGTTGLGGGGATGKGGNAGGGGTGGAAGSSGQAGGNGATGGAGGTGSTVSPLTFDVSTATDPVAPGGRLLYTVTIGNTSTVAVNAVTLSLTVPAGIQFGNAGDSEPNSSNCNGSANLCPPNTQVTWTLGAIAAGASRTVVINAQVLTTVGDGDSISATFKLSAAGLNPTTFTKAVQVYAESQSQLATGTSINPLVPGQRVTLDIDAGQIGNTPLANAVLQAQVPTGLTIVSISDGGTQSTPGVASWTIGAVAVGAALNRSVTVSVDADVAAGTILKTRTTLVHDSGLSVDAAAEYDLRVVSAAPYLAFNVAATPTPVAAGSNLLYMLTIGNLNTRAIDGVTVFLRVPAGIEFGNAADSQPNSSNCNGSSNLCPANYEVAWTLGTINAGDSQTIAVNARVLANAVGNGNLVRTSFALSATGVDEIDAVKTAQVYNSPSAQLQLSAAANPVLASQAYTYALDVGQIGVGALTNASVRLSLPRDVTLASASGGGTQDSAGDIVWPVGSVAVGSTLHLTANVTASATVLPGTLLVAHAQLTYDGGAEIDAATDYAIPVVAAPQELSLTVTAAPKPVSPGTRLLYTATLTNTTARSLSSVELMVRVPVGVQFGNAADADPHSSNCNGSSNLCPAGYEVYWDFATMAAGATQIVTINSQVLTTLLAGSLIPMPFSLTAAGLDAPILLNVVTPTQ